MTLCSIDMLQDHVVLRRMTEAFSQADTKETEGIAHLSVVDARKLYLPAGHSSMFSYCVHEMHMSDDAAFRRIRIARLGRQFPEIFPALAEGRLHQTAVVLLSPFLTADNAAELLTAAAHQTKSQIELLLARRFPQPGLATFIQPVPPASSAARIIPPAPGSLAAGPALAAASQLAPERVDVTIPEHSQSPTPRPKVTPLAPERFAVQLTIAQETHDKLRYAQALLGHAVPSGDLAQVLDRALDALIAKLEQRRFAATAKSRPATRRRKGNERHVPAAVRRAVWQRDGGRCTFTSDEGHRCEARTRLEFDHVTPVAKGGGHATAEGLRLRCRAHNQYEAERAFGAGFMRQKREGAQLRAAEKREAARACEARREHECEAATAARERALEVIPWLRQLGCRPDEACSAAALCEAIPGVPREERVRHALKSLAPSGAHRSVRPPAGQA